MENIKEDINKVIQQAVNSAVSNGRLPAVKIDEIEIEIPKENSHGDFSTNIAMKLAGQAKMAPFKISDIIIKNADIKDTYIEKIECAGPGFINFFLNEKWLGDTLLLIDKMGDGYGKSEYGKGVKVMVEFVSANPTGPLHMGNARGGALGDLISNILCKTGYEVTKEFYINDAGNQIEKFGISLEARYLQQLLGEDKVEFPKDGYFGDDIKEHAKNYIKEFNDSLVNKPSDELRKTLVDYALPKNIVNIKKGLKRYGVAFDSWFSEKSLYESGDIKETIEFLSKKGFTYEKDEALWLKGEALGVDKDEVLIKSNGFPTYFAADLAYHRNKFIKRRFDRVIDLWGADHHGHVARMKGAVSLFGVNPDNLDIIIFQLVRLFKDGEAARMSKRTGTAVSLDYLLDDVGKDAARFFFNMKTAGSHLDFDLDLAKKQSNENPVYYVQYAHARICSMIRLLNEEGISVPGAGKADLSLLKEKEEKTLIKKLAEYPEELLIASKTLEPARITRYALDLSSCFHTFYNACRVKGSNKKLMEARLVLTACTRTVIRNVLDIINITAPEKM